MYNGIMQMNSIRRLWMGLSKIWLIVGMVFVLLVLAIIAFYFFKKPADVKVTNFKINEKVGLSFEDFKDQLNKGMGNFLGDKELYVAKLEVVNVANFTRTKGVAAMWQGVIVRCDQFATQPSGAEENSLNCIGQAVDVSLTDTKLTGLDGTLKVGKTQTPYNGSVVSLADIKVSAAEAEEISNKAKSYRYQDNDDYYYKLTVESKTNRPLWQISRFCSIASKRNNSCDSENEWTSIVDAISGQVL